MLAGVGGGVTLSKALAAGGINPTNNTNATAGTQVPIPCERLNVCLGCVPLQFMFVLLIEVCGIWDVAREPTLPEGRFCFHFENLPG